MQYLACNDCLGWFPLTFSCRSHAGRPRVACVLWGLAAAATMWSHLVEALPIMGWLCRPPSRCDHNYCWCQRRQNRVAGLESVFLYSVGFHNSREVLWLPVQMGVSVHGKATGVPRWLREGRDDRRPGGLGSWSQTRGGLASGRLFLYVKDLMLEYRKAT